MEVGKSFKEALMNKGTSKGRYKAANVKGRKAIGNNEDIKYEKNEGGLWRGR